MKSRIIQRAQFAIDVPDYRDANYDLDYDKIANVIERFRAYDFTQHTTTELIAFMRGEDCRNIPALHAMAKAVVDTRPHIPTAKERREKRQAKAREQKNG